jgi:hypothetical protein
MKNSPNKSTKNIKVAKKFENKIKQKSIESEVFTQGIKNLFILKPLQGRGHESCS